MKILYTIKICQYTNISDRPYYNGKSQESKDLLFTLRGNKVYRGSSTKSEDIVLTFVENRFYSGNSTDVEHLAFASSARVIYTCSNGYRLGALYDMSGVYIYRGKSRFGTDIVATFRDEQVCRGMSKYNENDLYNVVGQTDIHKSMAIFLAYTYYRQEKE